MPRTRKPAPRHKADPEDQLFAYRTQIITLKHEVAALRRTLKPDVLPEGYRPPEENRAAFIRKLAVWCRRAIQEGGNNHRCEHCGGIAPEDVRDVFDIHFDIDAKQFPPGFRMSDGTGTHT